MFPNASDEPGELINHIVREKEMKVLMDLAQTKFQQYDENIYDFFHLPKIWFVKNDRNQNFEHQIDI